MNTVMNNIDVFKDSTKQDQYGYTSLEEDLFTPVGLYMNEYQLPIIFDSGCSVSVSLYKKDFGYTLTMTTEAKTMQGLGATVQVQGEGKVRWIFKYDYGVSQEVDIKAYYIPTSSVRLFSPQSYFIQESAGWFSLDKDGSVFTFTSGKTLTFKYSS